MDIDGWTRCHRVSILIIYRNEGSRNSADFGMHLNLNAQRPLSMLSLPKQDYRLPAPHSDQYLMVLGISFYALLQVQFRAGSKDSMRDRVPVLAIMANENDNGVVSIWSRGAEPASLKHWKDRRHIASTEPEADLAGEVRNHRRRQREP